MQKRITEYGSEFDWDSNVEYIYNDEQKNNEEDNIQYFRSGRDSLCAIALKYKNSYKNVLIPALCCDSMVEPFRKYNYKIEYYKLNKDMSSNIKDIISKIKKDTIFIYMNYFGIQTLSYIELQKLKMLEDSLVFVEDRTHDILLERGIEEVFKPDYTVCSIRKWLAIPDGGLLFDNLINYKFMKHEDSYFYTIRKEAQKLKSEYLYSGIDEKKEKFSKLLQKANIHLNNNIDLYQMSSESQQILKSIDFKKIREKRLKNVSVLLREFINFNKIKSIYSTVDKGNLYYPILVDNRDELQQAMAAKNIYCPVIWPLPQDAIGVCEISEYVSSHILALPCDQRYNDNDMKYIANTLKLIMEEI